jgi:hypothetical protein
MDNIKKELTEKYLIVFKDKKIKNLNECFDFILNCLDDSIVFLEKVPIKGEDKKSAAIIIIYGIYTEVISKNLPIYLKPFDLLIRFIVVQIIISKLIDFIVNKYNRGIWRKESNYA